MNRKTVVLVEPSFYGVSFAKAAYKKGYKVVCVVSSVENPTVYGYEDVFHDLIEADIRDVNSVLKAIKESIYYNKIDALIPATDFASAITAKVAEELGLKNVTYNAAFLARNKDYAREIYKQHSVPSAKFKKVQSYDDALIAAESIGFPVVLKPTNAASSQNVFFIKDKENLYNSMKKIQEFKYTYMDFNVRDEYLIEEYLDGNEFSVELFLLDGKPILSVVTEKQTSDLPYFVETMHVLPAPINEDLEEQITLTALKALEAIGLVNGPSHVEIKVTSNGPKIIEVNGRPGGDNISSDLLKLSFGLDVFENTVNYYTDSPIDLSKKHQKGSAIAYLTSEVEGELLEIIGDKEVLEHENLSRLEITCNPGDRILIPQSSDDRLGYVITVAETSEEAKIIADQLISRLKILIKREHTQVTS
ncbi:ATP-grasp domain-containing protein [Peribacillus sp. NPDC006672]|uniref:ATP-grasp domain-containing protein n=1 Tax=Peribacillus sp. NPDC006672 TaxID=3390606 RepID=UPI003D032CA1